MDNEGFLAFFVIDITPLFIRLVNYILYVSTALTIVDEVLK